MNFKCLLLFVGLLSGCASCIHNSTPAMMQQNGSDIYPIEMSIAKNSYNVKSQVCSARIVIDGKIHDMQKLDNYNFIYNYRRPEKSHKASYYYEVDCRNSAHPATNARTYKSGLYHLTIANRYVVGLESNRGTVGAVINLLGRGFEPEDSVEIAEMSCETKFISPNVLSFVVPPIKVPGTYNARLLSTHGNIGLGQFQIDLRTIDSNLKSLNLAIGEKKVLVISVNTASTNAETLIEVTTNIPNSISMPDVVIPTGSKSATVIVQGLSAGIGNLYLSSDGCKELKIPLEVTCSSVCANGTGVKNVESDNIDEVTDEELLSL